VAKVSYSIHNSDEPGITRCPSQSEDIEAPRYYRRVVKKRIKSVKKNQVASAHAPVWPRSSSYVTIL
jgi:ABC-type Fe3+-citrate transport system substrate-binding protein